MKQPDPCAAGAPPQRVLAIVPAHNEADSIAATLDDLKRCAPWADVLVVDDASTDATAEIAAAAGATVLRLACNLGVGGAVQTGYQYALRNNYDAAVQFDADGQHRADLLGGLVEALDKRQADLVIGSRVLAAVKFRFHPLRRIGSRLLSWVVSALARQQITDPTSGFRAVGRRGIRFFARHYPQTYLADTAEAIVWASRQKMKIVEIPAAMGQRTAGRSASGSVAGLGHTLRIILAVLVDCLEPPMGEEEIAK